MLLGLLLVHRATGNWLLSVRSFVCLAESVVLDPEPFVA